MDEERAVDRVTGDTTGDEEQSLAGQRSARNEQRTDVGSAPRKAVISALWRPRGKEAGRAEERAWIRHVEMLSWVLLAVGLLASTVVGAAWGSATKSSANNSAAATADSAKARLSQSLQDNFDVAGTIGTLVTVNPGLTNSQLS